MPETPEKLTPATPEDLADALAFALRFEGRKRVHNGDVLTSAIVARRLVEFLERAGFVVIETTARDRRGGARQQTQTVAPGPYCGGDVVKVTVVSPAAMLRPDVWPSIDSGCSEKARPLPPTRTLAPRPAPAVASAPTPT